MDQVRGLNNLANIEIIIENAKVPVIVDAGIGAPSEATKVLWKWEQMEVLLNTLVAQAKNQTQMASAMNLL